MEEKTSEKGEKKSRKHLFLISYGLLGAIILISGQVFLVLHYFQSGEAREPALWAGAVFFCVFGYYAYDIREWFQKHSRLAGIILFSSFGYILIFSNVFGLKTIIYFLSWVPLAMNVTLMRAFHGVVTEGKPKKEDKRQTP